MTIALKLTHDEPRLVYLALVYHLGRPGSDLDPATKLPAEHGLRDVKVVLGGELAADDAVIELDDHGYRKLLSAIYGSATELRGHHMRDGAPGTVPRFSETAQSLFPALVHDPGVALELAEAMVMMHRRIERAVGRAATEAQSSARRGRWPLGRR